MAHLQPSVPTRPFRCLFSILWAESSLPVIQIGKGRGGGVGMCNQI